MAMRIAWLKDLRLDDLEQVGGKNASLGEMIGGLAAAGIRVPAGFATTAQAFREFIDANGLGKRIDERLGALDANDVTALAACGAEIRSWIAQAPFPAHLEQEILSYFQQLEAATSGNTSFAVRSSFLNISGADNVLEAIRQVYASLYNDRAISYRAHQGFAHGAVALSAAVQQT